MHCFSHHVDEPADDSTYMICGECGHVYQTAGELRREYRRARWAIHKVDRRAGIQHPAFRPLPTWLVLVEIWTIRAKKIFSCQHCTHDF